MTKTELKKVAKDLNVKVALSWPKDRIKTTILEHINGTIAKIDRDIEHHEKHRSAYFWRPAATASQRRSEEKRKSYNHTIVIGSDHYKYRSIVTCSCKNYYYSGTFTLNTETRTMSLWRQLRKRIIAISEEVHDV